MQATYLLLYLYLIICQTIIKEEDRLSSIIAEIDEDVRIVPRGAFVQVPTAEVVKNRSFEGETMQHLLHYYLVHICKIHSELLTIL